jgi:hypothetical protein
MEESGRPIASWADDAIKAIDDAIEFRDSGQLLELLLSIAPDNPLRLTQEKLTCGDHPYISIPDLRAMSAVAKLTNG